MPRSAILLLTLALVGCAPYTHARVDSLHAFTAPTRCGQGPYEIVVPATGARWGEELTFEVFGPYPPALEVAIEVDGETLRHDRVDGLRVPHEVHDQNGTHIDFGGYEGPTPHEACSLAEVEAQLAAGQPAVGVRVATQDASTAQEDAAVGSLYVVGEGVDTDSIETESLSPAIDPRLQLERVAWERPSPAAMLRAQIGVTPELRVSWTNQDPDADAPLAPGTPIVVRVWSTTPNLLESLTFVVSHYQAFASVPDEEYAAHLRERAATRERRAAERAAAPPTRRERRRARRAARRAERRRARNEFCQAHHEDERCWGEGGYEGHVARARQRELEQRRAREDAEAAAALQPDGPPPAPLAEAPPPKASLHATWVAGYWHWVGQWVWIAGRWSVPEQDILARATVVAPSAPPPPRAEPVPTPPAPGLVWSPGYWQWDGVRFVWVAGQWNVARAGAVWVGPAWELRARGAVFIPGRWTVQVR